MTLFICLGMYMNRGYKIERDRNQDYIKRFGERKKEKLYKYN